MPLDFRPIFQRALGYAAFLERYGTAENRTRWQQVYDAVALTAEWRELLKSFRRKMNVLCVAGPWCGDCVNACPIFQRFAAEQELIDLRFVNRAQSFPGAEEVTEGRAASEEKGADPEDIRATPIGKILVRWGILTAERVDKALLVQQEKKGKGLNARIGDVMTEMGMISAEQRDDALAAQSGHGTLADSDVAVARELSICGAPRVPVLVFLSEDFFECERFGERTLARYRERTRGKLVRMEGPSCPLGVMPPAGDGGGLLGLEVGEWLGHFERVQWMLLTSPRLSRLHGES